MHGKSLVVKSKSLLSALLMMLLLLGGLIGLNTFAEAATTNADQTKLPAPSEQEYQWRLYGTR
jgi:hypothetical protein